MKNNPRARISSLLSVIAQRELDLVFNELPLSLRSLFIKMKSSIAESDREIEKNKNKKRKKKKRERISWIYRIRCINM